LDHPVELRSCQANKQTLCNLNRSSGRLSTNGVFTEIPFNNKQHTLVHHMLGQNRPLYYKITTKMALNE